MKNMLFMMVLFCVSSLAGQARNVNANSFDDSLRSEADKLLTEWMDAFLAYQYTCSDSALDGGVLCPACARMHGRIGDAVLPLMYLAEKTGNQKYLLGAKRLMAWMENVLLWYIYFIHSGANTSRQNYCIIHTFLHLISSYISTIISFPPTKSLSK